MRGDRERLGNLAEPALGDPVHEVSQQGRLLRGIRVRCAFSVSYRLDETARAMCDSR